MRLDINDALNGDLIGLPFLDEIANAGADIASRAPDCLMRCGMEITP